MKLFDTSLSFIFPWENEVTKTQVPAMLKYAPPSEHDVSASLIHTAAHGSRSQLSWVILTGFLLLPRCLSEPKCVKRKVTLSCLGHNFTHKTHLCVWLCFPSAINTDKQQTSGFYFAHIILVFNNAVNSLNFFKNSSCYKYY